MAKSVLWAWAVLRNQISLDEFGVECGMQICTGLGVKQVNFVTSDFVVLLFRSCS